MALKTPRARETADADAAAPPASSDNERPAAALAAAVVWTSRAGGTAGENPAIGAVGIADAGPNPRRTSRVRKQLARPGHPAADRAHRASQPLGRLVVRQAFDIAEDDRRPEPIRQPGDLTIDDGPELTEPGLVRVGCELRLLIGPLLPNPSPRPVATASAGDPERDPIQPVRQQVAVAQCAGLPDQDQERRLEGVLDVVRVIEQAPADAQHHRPVPRHDRLEGDLVAIAHEPRQELPFREPRHRTPAE